MENIIFGNLARDALVTKALSHFCLFLFTLHSFLAMMSCLNDYQLSTFPLIVHSVSHPKSHVNEVSVLNNARHNCGYASIMDHNTKLISLPKMFLFHNFWQALYTNT